MNKLDFLFVFAIFSIALGMKSQVFERPILINSRAVSGSLHIDNAYHDAGKWGINDTCPTGYAVSMEVTYRGPAFDHLDETAVNGVRLYCETTEGLFEGYVESTVGTEGETQGVVTCPSTFITGFQANTLAYQGAIGEDVAVEDILISCAGVLLPTIPPAVKKSSGPSSRDFKVGDWSSIAECQTGSAVCGIETRFEDGALGDATAICEFVLYCCPLPANATITQ